MSYASLPDVEDVVYMSVKNLFKDEISGDVYKPETRPVDSNLEDIVVTASAGTIRQIQEFIVYVNVFVPDISNKKKKNVMNRKRLDELKSYEDEILASINEDNAGLYEASLESPTKYLKVHEVQQSCVSFCFNIKCLTFNL